MGSTWSARWSGGRDGGTASRHGPGTRRAQAPHASLTADLAAEIGVLRERIETLSRVAARREPDVDERTSRAWLAVELDALRAVADRAHVLAARVLVDADEDSAAA